MAPRSSWAGESYAKVEKALGRDAAFVVLGIVVVVLVSWRICKHRAERATERTGDEAPR